MQEMAVITCVLLTDLHTDVTVVAVPLETPEQLLSFTTESSLKPFFLPSLYQIRLFLIPATKHDLVLTASLYHAVHLCGLHLFRFSTNLFRFFLQSVTSLHMVQTFPFAQTLIEKLSQFFRP